MSPLGKSPWPGERWPGKGHAPDRTYFRAWVDRVWSPTAAIVVEIISPEDENRAKLPSSIAQVTRGSCSRICRARRALTPSASGAVTPLVARHAEGTTVVGIDGYPKGWAGVVLRDGRFERALAASTLQLLLDRVPEVVAD